MKIKPNITLYICEHCNKKLQRKEAMILHEKFCYKNPDNERACHGCIYIEEISIQYEKDVMRLGEGLGVIFDTETRTTKSFRCNKLNKVLYPFKVEKKGLPEKYPDTFESQEPMPKTCEFKPKDFPF